MLDRLRQMPNGVRVLLAYGFLLLGFVALTLPLVVEQAVEAPVSMLGLLWMLLLAYLIFTLTLILQRKQAGWGLSIGLATLSLPLVALLYGWAGLAGALLGLALAAVLFLSLRRRAVREWFSEP
jgi:cytochrome bd-type quinol oxidase subunit 1